MLGPDGVDDPGHQRHQGTQQPGPETPRQPFRRDFPQVGVRADAQFLIQVVYRLVVRRDSPAHAVCCLWHGQQGAGDLFGQHRVGLPGHGQRPVRIKGGRQRARKLVFLALRQHPEVRWGEPFFAHHLLWYTGAHDACIHLALLHSLDDLVHRQANEPDFLEIRFRIDPVVQHFLGCQQVAAKGVRCNGSHTFPSQIGEFLQIRAVAPDQDHRTQRFGG